MLAIFHEGVSRSFRRLVLRGDGWGYALIRNRDTNELQWWQAQWTGRHWATTDLIVSKDTVLKDLQA